MHPLDFVLLILTPALQAWLGVLLIRRGAHKEFPWFTTYTAFSIVVQNIRWLLQPDTWTYFYTYWIAEALYSILGFLAIYEAFRRVFRQFYLMWWWFKFLLPLAGGVMLAIAIIKGVLFPPMQAPPLLATIFVAELAVRCFQGGIFALFVLLVRFHSLPARTYAFGISLGFAISAFGIFLTILIRSEFGTRFASILRVIPPVAYIIAVATWLLFFIRPEPSDRHAGQEMAVNPERVIEILEQYTREIKGWFTRCSQMPS